MQTTPLSALVIFATITGNNEAVADIIIAELEHQGVAVQKSEISQTEAQDLQNYPIVIIVPYTYDQGSLPDEGLDFYEDLADQDLTGVVYGIAGSGDLYYQDTYCLALDSFDQQIQPTGANRGAEIVRINLRPDDQDRQVLITFTDQVIRAAKAAH